MPLKGSQILVSWWWRMAVIGGVDGIGNLLLLVLVNAIDGRPLVVRMCWFLLLLLLLLLLLFILGN